jgi:immunity protein 7 of polymorphic toxin system
MHEFHAWIGLSESTEESDLGGLQDAVVELQELANDSRWHDAVFEVRNLNGQYFVTAEGMVNRRREEGERLDLFLAIIARKLPGSWGLIYERDDEMPDPPGPNAFRVRVLARGRIVERPDPFLSPCNPVIEDLTNCAVAHGIILSHTGFPLIQESAPSLRPSYCDAFVLIDPANWPSDGHIVRH